MAKHIPFFLLSLSLLLLSFCIKLVLVDTPSPLSCSENQFACRDGSKCVSRSRDLCDGYKDCDDYSDEFASKCDNCTADHLFSCLIHRGVNVCLNVKFKCDGISHCGGADELLSECESSCSPSTKFVCKYRGMEACLSKRRYQCNGVLDCDDGSDEAPSVCANCTKPGLHMCRDGSLCIEDEYRCDGFLHCVDGSDEADSWSNCTVCAQNDTVQCPGFPDNCAKVCDGKVTCPDSWDELLSTCEAFKVPCTEQAGLYPCKDGSRCLNKQRLCNAHKDCDSGEDEAAKHCKAEHHDDKDKNKCQYWRSKRWPLHTCDTDACVFSSNLCSATNEPLCKDGSDMKASFCNQTGERKCFTNFHFGKVDPYRWPCEDESKCILRTSLCDAKLDCPDGSDEKQGCPWYVRLNFWFTILICLAAVLQSLLLHSLFAAWSLSLIHI